MTYGLCLLPLKDADYGRLETAQRGIAKKIQGLARNTSNPACYNQLGWVDLTSRIIIEKLMFLWQLISLPMSNVYKAVTSIRLMTLKSRELALISPCGDLMSIAERFDLRDTVFEMLESGAIPSKNEWKAFVCRKVRDQSLKKWQLQCLLYKNLNLYKVVVQHCKPVVWWRICQKNPKLISICKSMVILLCGNSNLHVNKSWGNFEEKRERMLCTACNLNQIETLEHFMFVCDGQFIERQQLLHVISKYDVLGTMSKSKQLELIFGSEEIISTEDYVTIAKIIHSMYNNPERTL